MEKKLTQEEFMILKMLIAKGIKDGDSNSSLIAEDSQISSLEERIIWIENCIARK